MSEIYTHSNQNSSETTSFGWHTAMYLTYRSTPTSRIIYIFLKGSLPRSHFLDVMQRSPKWGSIELDVMQHSPKQGNVE